MGSRWSKILVMSVITHGSENILPRNTFRLVFFLLCSSMAYPKPLAPHMDETDKPVLNYPTSAELSQFRSHSIDQDPPGTESYGYLGSNETKQHLYEACLTDGGAYVSVGTGGINVASSGLVSHLFLMDYNRGIALFNKINLQLMARSRNRFEYLSRLLTGKVDPNFEKDAQTQLASAVINLVERTGGEFRRAQIDSELLDSWKKFGVNLSAEEWEALESKKGDLSVHALSGAIRSNIPTQIQRHVSSSTLGQTIYGNDTRFETLRRMILDRRVTVLIGDLTGSKTMASIGETLNAPGVNLKLAAVNVSNVPGSLMENPSIGRPQIHKMLTNLEKLQVTRLFLTSIPPDQATNGFRFYTLKKKDFPLLATIAERENWKESIMVCGFRQGKSLLYSLPGDECK